MKSRLFMLTLFFLFSFANAHSGRTNSSGCHNDRKNGGYHCHNSGSSSKSSSRTYPSTSKYAKRYERSDWPHWADDDSDCQNTRAEILIRDSKTPVKFKRNKGCTVTWGTWYGLYTGQTFFKASDVDIDHIVPLKHAHEYGGASWSRSQKRTFANDVENLLTVEDNANQSKGAQAPHEWMPPNEIYHCQYVKKWKRIKDKYDLKYSKEELSKISKVLASCS